MRLRFIDQQGAEHHIENLAALIDALRTGQLREETLVYDLVRRRWAPARSLDIVKAASVRLAIESEQSHDAVSSGDDGDVTESTAVRDGDTRPSEDGGRLRSLQAPRYSVGLWTGWLLALMYSARLAIVIGCLLLFGQVFLWARRGQTS